jgi:hypothetical protein
MPYAGTAIDIYFNWTVYLAFVMEKLNRTNGAMSCGPMFEERKALYSALFTYLVGWHAGAVSFP